MVVIGSVHKDPDTKNRVLIIQAIRLHGSWAFSLEAGANNIWLVNTIHAINCMTYIYAPGGYYLSLAFSEMLPEIKQWHTETQSAKVKDVTKEG
jgi:hypothetical protein